jgi:hypothetical protein
MLICYVCSNVPICYSVISVKPKNKPKKPKPNMSVFDFLNNRSAAVVLKTEIFKNRKIEPNCRFKPNAEAYSQ